MKMHSEYLYHYLAWKHSYGSPAKNCTHLNANLHRRSILHYFMSAISGHAASLDWGCYILRELSHPSDPTLSLQPYPSTAHTYTDLWLRQSSPPPSPSQKATHPRRVWWMGACSAPPTRSKGTSWNTNTRRGTNIRSTRMTGMGTRGGRNQRSTRRSVKGRNKDTNTSTSTPKTHLSTRRTIMDLTPHGKGSQFVSRFDAEELSLFLLHVLYNRHF